MKLVGSPMNFVSLGRIGKRNKNGHQSLRITLESPEVVHHVLKNNHTLDSNLNIFLDADLTNEQRKELNALKNELKVRQRNGEHRTQSNFKIY